MTTLTALLLGLLQGVTEFFPVSSSAHLKLAKQFFDIHEGADQVLFDLTCHLGTLCALLFFLRKEIYQLFFKEPKKLALFFLALLPLIPCYFLLKPVRQWCCEHQVLGLSLMGTACILFCGEWLQRKQENKTNKTLDALWIGAMQGVALIPGISRSASTISMARCLGWRIEEAVRFSFLLAIPTIIGGNTLELSKELLSSSSTTIATFPFSIYAVAFFASSICGLTVVRFAVRFLEKGNLRPFAWYCLTLGALVSIYYLSTTPP